MRKILSIVVTSALAIPLLAAAQPGPTGHGGHHGVPDWLDPGFIARVLEMTEEQVADMRMILEENQEAVAPLRMALGELGEALGELLASPDPDPTEVGMLTLEIHHLRTEVHDLRDATIDAIAALLTPEQLDRWEVAKDVLKALAHPRGPASERPPAE